MTSIGGGSSNSSNINTSVVDLDEILSVAQEAAKLAGDEIQRVLRQDTSTDATNPPFQQQIVTKSNNVDLVTETDQACEAIITNFLKKKFPLHKIIGEESSGAACHYTLTSDPTWTIDPIDGTTNFVHRLDGQSCVLIAFLLDKDVKVGVTYNPSTEEMYWAVKGRGAYVQTTKKNGSAPPHARRICVSKTTNITKALISMDPGYGRDNQSIDRFTSVYKRILHHGVRNVRTFGCSGLCLANVACGKLDASFEQGSWEYNTGPKIWDLCAGKLLVEEAGGVTRDVTNLANKEKPMDILQRSSFVAATPELADQILNIIYNTAA